MIVDLKEDMCPECGCSEVEEEGRRHLHCNGHWNEYRKFQCGRSVFFSPNFMRLIVEKKCQRSKEYKEYFEKLHNLKNELYSLASDSFVNDEKLRRLKDFLKYW